MEDYALLQQNTKSSALAALTISLGDFRGWQASSALYDFLDNCILRLVRKTVKYVGDFVELKKSLIATSVNDDNRSVTLLLMAVLEQWPYFIEVCQASDLDNVVNWLARYITVLHFIGEDREMLDVIFDRLGNQIKGRKDLSMSNIASEILNDPEWQSTMSNLLEPEDTTLDDKTILNEGRGGQSPTPLPILPLGPSEEAEDHSSLTRWTKMEPAEAVEDGAVAYLLLCLCSKYHDIRMQSLSNIQIFMAKLEVCILLYIAP